MTHNEAVIFPKYVSLVNLIMAKDYVPGKERTVELLNISFKGLEINEGYLDFITRKTPKNYVEKEHSWYMSQSLSIYMMKPNKIWEQVAGMNGLVNSNYGFLAYHDFNGSQFENVFHALARNENTRQAIMIYNRPSMHVDWNANGKRDFVCALYHHFFIRKSKLYSIVNMRSVDAWHGFFSDLPWFMFMHQQMFDRMRTYNEYLNQGTMDYNINSFHLYESTWPKAIDMVESCLASGAENSQNSQE